MNMDEEAARKIVNLQGSGVVKMNVLYVGPTAQNSRRQVRENAGR